MRVSKPPSRSKTRSTEDRHDPHRPLVFDDLEERKRCAVRGGRHQRPPVEWAAEVIGIARDDVRFRMLVQEPPSGMPGTSETRHRRCREARSTTPAPAASPASVRPRCLRSCRSESVHAESFRGPVSRQLHRSIRRPVVRDQKLEVFESLGERGFDGLRQKRSRVVRRRNDADSRRSGRTHLNRDFRKKRAANASDCLRMDRPRNRARTASG